MRRRTGRLRRGRRLVSKTQATTAEPATPPTRLAFSGLHHLKVPVSDLDVSAAWYEKALRATVLADLDHRDPEGNLFARMLQIPGVEVLVELRLAPKAAAATDGYDPITLQVDDQAHLRQWVDHLDAADIQHSPELRSMIGFLLVVPDPDGLMLRIHTRPTADTALDSGGADHDSPWTTPPLMRR
jgi:catechol 2,3-dioxygenase-like lactoylglutathione lyase family enzyme